MGGLLGGPLRSSWSRTPETNCRGVFESRWGAWNELGEPLGDDWGAFLEGLALPWGIFLAVLGFFFVRASRKSVQADAPPKPKPRIILRLSRTPEMSRKTPERSHCGVAGGPLGSCWGAWDRHWGAFLESLGLPWGTFSEGPCVLLGQELQNR